MNYEEYVVKVFSDGAKFWHQNGKLHRTDGPACECFDGTKHWYLEGIKYSEEEFNEKMKVAPSCNGKTVEIDGKKYKLVEV